MNKMSVLKEEFGISRNLPSNAKLGHKVISMRNSIKKAKEDLVDQNTNSNLNTNDVSIISPILELQGEQINNNKTEQQNNTEDIKESSENVEMTNESSDNSEEVNREEENVEMNN